MKEDKARCAQRRVPQIAMIGFAAASLSIPAFLGAQGRTPGRNPGGSPSQRDNPAPRDTPRSDPAPRRDPAPPPQREEYRPPTRRDDPPARREEPSRRNEAPARRDDTLIRRDEPARRDEPNRQGETRPRRDDISADRPIRDRIDTGRANPRDDTRADRPAERNPGDTSSGSTGPGGIFNRTRPGGEGSRPDRDYRGERYDTGAARRDNRDTRSGDRSSGSRTPSQSDDPRPSRDRALDIFSRSREGRQYNNGITLRSGGYVADRGIRGFFPHEYCYYPYYYPRYDPAIVFFSPYSYYYGVCPPYVYRRQCHYYPPRIAYIDLPIYMGIEFNSWREGYGDDDYYLERRNYYTDPSQVPDRELETAIRDIRESFRFSNINMLANLTDPDIRVAIFLKGKYEYSLDASDYLDMTRDMFRSTETISFDLQRIHKRSADVYVVSGKQIYLNRDSKRRTVFVSFVLERVHGRWTITQVGTAPERIEEPRN